MKIIKTAVTHGRASQRMLNCFQELLETTDHICQNTNESDVSDHEFTQYHLLHLFNGTNIAVINTPSLALQI